MRDPIESVAAGIRACGTITAAIADADAFLALSGLSNVLRAPRLKPGQLRRLDLAMDQCRLGPAVVAHVRTATDLLIEADGVRPGTTQILLPITGRSTITYDRVSIAARPGFGAVIGADRPLRLRVAGPASWIAVQLDRTVPEGVPAAEGAARPDRPGAFAAALSSEATAVWTRAVGRCLSAATGSDRGQPAVTAILLQAMRASLLLPAPLPAAVKRAMAYMDAHISEPISMVDVAAHAQVGPRRLQMAFVAHCGVPPSIWLRNRRLDLVHAALSEAAPDALTVTQAALDGGFAHLGEFAAYYRARFGTTPSATLGKRRVQSAAEVAGGAGLGWPVVAAFACLGTGAGHTGRL